MGSPDTKQTGSVKTSYNVSIPERAAEGLEGEAGGRGTGGQHSAGLERALSSRKAQTSAMALSAHSRNSSVSHGAARWSCPDLTLDREQVHLEGGQSAACSCSGLTQSKPERGPQVSGLAPLCFHFFPLDPEAPFQGSLAMAE